MKKISFYILILFSTVIFAQDNSIKIENVVNEQFGTLLESLLTDGKIDEANAKNYLEAVFGYDDDVNNYLNTNSFTQQFNSFKQIGTSKLSTDALMTQLNSSLLSFIPAEKQQAFMQHMQAQMMMQGTMTELMNGQIGVNTIQFASGVVQGLKETREENIKNKAIIKKLELITPTLSKLNSITNYKKLKIVDEVDSNINWIENRNPIKIDVPDYPTTQFTTNYTSLQNGYLLISAQNFIQGNSWEKTSRFEPIRIYKNSEKFDFSKDFKMDIYIKINKSLNNFELNIGKGFKVRFQRSSGQLTIFSPLDYKITEEYGVVEENDKRFFYDGRRVDDLRKIFLGEKSGISIREKANLDINFEAPLKFTIKKVGDSFYCSFNDFPYTIKREIKYFPDKYYLGALLSGYNKKDYVEIHKLELEHL